MSAHPDELWLLRDLRFVTPHAGRPVRLLQATTPHEWAEARRLVREYAATLEVDLSFQNFEQELEHFTVEYAAPTGAFILAEDAGQFIACIGVRRFADDIGEIKRLYYDTAQIATEGTLEALTKLVPVSQIVYGTDFPYRTAADHSNGVTRVFKGDDLNKVDRENALKLVPRLKSA